MLLVARKRYHIDGMRVAAWLFWEFFHARWKILFLHGGDTWGGHKMRIVMQGERYLCEVTLWVMEGTLGHARWMWDEIWKVILHASHVRTLVWWRGHLATQDGCEVRFEKSSCMHLMWELWCGGGDTWPHKMDVRWDLKSHLMCILHENFGVVEGTLGHSRWTWGEI